MIPGYEAPTSRRMVKQQEQTISDPSTCNVVGRKKFCVVFSNAWTLKDSQYETTLRAFSGYADSSGLD